MCWSHSWPGPCRRWHVTRAVSAVTGAFLAVRREVFVTVGGFDEIAFPVGYSDIDLALKLRARGLEGSAMDPFWLSREIGVVLRKKG